MIRLCPNCKVGTEFHQGAWQCRDCANAKARLNYAKRKRDPEGQEKLRQQRKRETEFRKQRKQEAVELLGSKCNDCGGSFPLPVYDFHHQDPNEKDGEPSFFLNKKSDRWKEELAKCVLLCSNCHRIRHWECK